MNRIKNIFKNKKMLIICIVIIIAISMFIFIRNYGNDRSLEKESIQENETDYISQSDYCLPNFELNMIIGKWFYFGYETETPPYFIFDKNKQFVLFDWVEKGYRIEGEWELVGNNEAIKLKFYNLDKHWEKLLDDNLYDYFDGVYEYDREKKEIAFRLGYFEREEDFSGECSEDRFYIDLFNVYLYKDEVINYTLDELRECWDLIENNLVGRWEYIGGELEIIPYIDLYENGDFITNAWGGNGISVTGQWEFIDRSIKFDFYDDNDYWEGFSEERMEKYSSNNIVYSGDANIVSVPVHYTEHSGDFTGECSLDHFYIDMLNYFLHKKI